MKGDTRMLITDNKRTVYVCKECNLLLIKVNGTLVKRLGFCAILTDDCMYTDDDEAELIDDNETFSCPVCDDEVCEEETLALPDEAIVMLISLWKELSESKKKEHLYRGDLLYGIPLDEPRLAEIITETML